MSQRERRAELDPHPAAILPRRAAALRLV